MNICFLECFVNGLMVNVVQLGYNNKITVCLFFKPGGVVQLLKESDSLGEELRERPAVSRKPSSGDYYRHISETQRAMDSLKVNLTITLDLSLLEYMAVPFLEVLHIVGTDFTVFSNIFSLNFKRCKHEFIIL